VRALFAMNKVRFARAEQWSICSVVQNFYQPLLSPQNLSASSSRQAVANSYADVISLTLT